MDYKKIQKKFRELSKPKFYAKGAVIEYVTREGVKSEYANALGDRRQRRANRMITRQPKTDPNYRQDGLTKHQRILERKLFPELINPLNKAKK